jgi:ribA/ribD-fused uncharacterized protein
VTMRYRTVEHFYQASKASTETEHLHIAGAGKAKEAKRRGRAVDLRPGWEEVRYEVMLIGLRAKFAPDSESAKFLLGTGERGIREENPFDEIWGTGRDGSGLNLLGKALVEVRTRLQGRSR